MGIAKIIAAQLETLGITVDLIKERHFTLIQCSATFYLNVIQLHVNHEPNELISLQEAYQQDGKLLVHLWEDVWMLNQTGVLSRVKSFLGLNTTLHGRKSKLKEINVLEAKAFLNQYHLQGFVRAKYYYGLTIDHELIAVASFSGLRPMKLKGEDYKSAELVRFASKDGYTITGGLSKLIKHFLTLKKPNDLMTYADRDWSLGKGYDQLGFKLSSTTLPSYLYVEEKSNLRYFPHRLPKKLLSDFDEQKELNLDDYLAKHGFVKAFNTGNLKYHLYI